MHCFIISDMYLLGLKKHTEMASRLRLHKKRGRPPNEEARNLGNSEINVSGDNKRIRTEEGSRIKLPKIFQSAIASAKKHGINLAPGKENKGDGNCSYESVIFNINERSCFLQKLKMTQDYYRNVWNTVLTSG